MGNIKIISAQPKDIYSIFEINKLTWFDTYGSEKYGVTKNLRDKEQKSHNNTLRLIKKRKKEIQENPGSCWVAIDVDIEKVIGYTLGKKYDDKPYNELWSIYILKEYQRRGIGKSLFNKVINYLGKEKPIILSVIAYNTKAVWFYEKMGFKFNKELPDFELLPGKFVPEIEMIFTHK